MHPFGPDKLEHAGEDTSYRMDEPALALQKAATPAILPASGKVQAQEDSERKRRHEAEETIVNSRITNKS